MATLDGLLILANDGHGKFDLRAAEIFPSAIPYSLAAADYDQDGDVDIFAACYNPRSGVNHILFARPVPYHEARNGGKNVLLRNDGGWRFSHATKAVGLDENNDRFSYAATWEDVDNDGDLDLYVANDFGSNNLYLNETEPGGPPKFRDVAAETGVLDVAAGMSATWGDYDNDGQADLYVSNMFSSAGNRVAYQDRFLSGTDEDVRSLFQRHARGNSLFRNTGNGQFEDVTLASGVALGRWAWGSLFADLNHDGWQDLIVANGFITQEDPGDL